jgi:hypothetical protein
LLGLSDIRSAKWAKCEKKPLGSIDVEETASPIAKKINGDSLQRDRPSRDRVDCPPYANEEYTIGWASALPIDMAAAKGMLDEEHRDPQTPPQDADHNTYLLETMSGFRTVIACLPKDELGASSAAVVTKDMLFTFPNT